MRHYVLAVAARPGHIEDAQPVVEAGVQALPLRVKGDAAGGRHLIGCVVHAVGRPQLPAQRIPQVDGVPLHGSLACYHALDGENAEELLNCRCHLKSMDDHCGPR